MLENVFLIPCGTIGVDLGWIGEGRKLSDFEQKPWAIAHGFEQGRFWQDLQIAPNFLKRRLSAWKCISDTLRDYRCRFGMSWRGSKIDRFWAKGLGYSPWFWTGPILASLANRSKLPETPPKCLKMDFWYLTGLSVSIWDELARVENWPILSKSPGL